MMRALRVLLSGVAVAVTAIVSVQSLAADPGVPAGAGQFAQASLGDDPTELNLVKWAKAERYVFQFSSIVTATDPNTGEECPLAEGDLAVFEQVPEEKDQSVQLKIVTSRRGSCRAASTVQVSRADLRATLIGLSKRLDTKIRQASVGSAMLASTSRVGLNLGPSPKQPQLMDGKKTLFQRVLTRPGGELRSAPDLALDGKPLPAFSVYFVYRRLALDNREWLEVGVSRDGAIDGWIPGEQTIDWKQTLSVAFTNPAPRGRSLFFNSETALGNVLMSNRAADLSAELLQVATSGNLPDDFPVIGLEPSTWVDFTKQFYLLPILEWREVTPPSGFSTRLLEVASVTSNSGGRTDSVAAPSTAQEMKDFKAAIVFVIDTTKSMDTYIARARQAVQKISKELTSNPALANRLSFGLIGYRNNLQKTPALEYLTRTFVDLSEGRDLAYFLRKAETVTATTVSSHSWDEDSFAGVLAAVNDLDWTPYGARYIIMFTDAGALRANDETASSRLDAQQIDRLLIDKNIGTFVLHLRTPAGKRDHEFAASQYKAMTEFPNLGHSYYEIDGGSVEQFGNVVDTVVEQLSVHLAKVAQGQIAPATSGGRNAKGRTEAIERARAQAAAMSRAMQVAYLGRVRGTQIPVVFDSWLADRDLEQPDLMTVDVRVLLTKTQLSDLQQTMKLIIEAAKKSEISPKDFFDQLRSAAASMSRDPTRVARAQNRKLADIGLIGEYLEDLPYRSKVMNIDRDTWENWSLGEQEAFVDEIDAKIRLYQRFHDDTGKWIALDGGKVPGDAVYPVPLDSLP
jgi:hypothetical protein